MLKWFHKQTAFAGSAFYRGNWPLRKEEFYSLRSHGIEVSESATPAENVIWALKLNHPQWGAADLFCMRDAPLPPHILIDMDVGLIETEKQALKSCQCTISLRSVGTQQNLLQDRKNGLRYLHLALGEEGVAALDHVSQKFWSKGTLDIEMSHGAELDIESLFTVHAVSNEGTDYYWVHTHGLGEIGYFDIDILQAHSDYLGFGYETIRGLAFQIVEEKIKAGDEARIAGEMKATLVPVAEFLKNADPEFSNMRADAPESHTENRVVLCEPGGRNLFSFKNRTFRPAKVFTSPVDERNLIPFSHETSELMSRRARATYSLLKELHQELAEFKFTTIVKLGYHPEGRSDDSNEHMWFEVHEFIGDKMDATLLNEPFTIPGMKAGQRAIHSIDRLTDWQIITPGLGINPRRNADLRWLRENREALLEAVRNQDVNSSLK
ncbi:MAG: DUF4026 domain-containing protein [Verrucomicrobiales bacterium]